MPNAFGSPERGECRPSNNHTQKQKSHFFVGAVGSALTSPLGAMLACALRSSSSQKSHFVAIFGSPVVAFLRLNPERVNLRDFLIGEALIIRVSRKSQGAARDFWERGETVPQRLRIAFRQTAATRVLFRRARREKTKCRAAAGEPCGGEHLVVFQITEKSFVSFKTFFVHGNKLAKGKTAFLPFALCALWKAGRKGVNFCPFYNR